MDSKNKKWNKEQYLAINTIDKNVLLNAGAGTGKTEVLSERYIKILKDGNFEGISDNEKVESIIAITFTNKATNELIDRISKKINKESKEDSKFKIYYENLRNANIMTIDAFCAKMLRENPLEAKIDPDFKIMSEIYSDEIIENKIDKIIREDAEYFNNNSFYDFLINFNYDSLEKFKFSLMAFYKDVKNGGNIEDLQNTIFLLENLNNKDFYNALKKMSTLFAELLGKIDNRTSLKPYMTKEKLEIFDTKDISDDFFEELEEILNLMPSSNKEEIRSVCDEINDLADEVFIFRDALNVQAYKLIYDIIIKLERHYSEYKDRNGFLDYKDLSDKFLNLLDNEDILKEYRRKFKYIMIDEFQDTNEIQKEIFYKINCGVDGMRLFMVGDSKQSIYGFRGADLNVYDGVRSDFYNSAEKSSIIGMNVNYRSDRRIIDYVNSLFVERFKNYEKLISKEEHENGLVKDTYVELDQCAENIELYKIKVKDKSVGRESELIAKKIKELNESYDYKDIKILLRSGSSSKTLEGELCKLNIPYVNNTDKEFYKCSEIKTVMCFLSYLINEDDLSLIELLRSDIFLIDDNKVFSLMEDENKEELKKYIDISKYRDRLDNLKLNEILEMFIEDTKYYQKLAQRKNALSAIQNVKKIIKIVSSYYLSGLYKYSEIYNLIKKSSLSPENNANILSEGDDSVEILSIHKSKGLEAKVIILAQLPKKTKNILNYIIYKYKKGFALKRGDRGLYGKIKKSLKDKEEQEEMRVLYVALTRAKERLYIFSQCYGEYSKIISEKEHLIKVNEDCEEFSDIDTFEDNAIKERYEDRCYICDDLVTFEVYKHENKIIKPSKLNETYFRKKDSVSACEDILKADLRGDIVHEFCEKYYGYDKDILIEKILRKRNLICDEKIKKDIMPYIDNYINYYNSFTGDNVFKELPFYSTYNGKILSGVIDRVEFEKDTVTIIDFKTGSSLSKDDMIKEYESQLNLYKYALGGYEVKTKLLFLKDNTSHDYE